MNPSKEVEISNTLVKGRLTEIRCLEYFLAMGFIVSTPEIPCPYDFLLDVNGKIYKIQVKTCRLTSDDSCLEFNTSSTTHNSKGYTKRNYTMNDVDFFATIYKDTCYLVPFNECGSKQKRLRLVPTKNGQKKNIAFAEEYIAEEVLKNYI